MLSKMAEGVGFEPKQSNSQNFAITCFCPVKIGDFTFLAFLRQDANANKYEPDVSLIVPNWRLGIM